MGDESFGASFGTSAFGILFPYLLKIFGIRWFLFGSWQKGMTLFNLRLDRIVSVELVTDIPYRENPDYDT